MFSTYEAVYKHGMLQRIDERPEGNYLRVMVTVLEKEKDTAEFQESIEELLQRTKGVVKPPASRDEIDRDIAAMRSEWSRERDR